MENCILYIVLSKLISGDTCGFYSFIHIIGNYVDITDLLSTHGASSVIDRIVIIPMGRDYGYYR